MKSKILPFLISNIAVATIVWICAAKLGGDSAALAQKDSEIAALKAELAKNRSRPQTPRTRSRNNVSADAGEANQATAATQARRDWRQHATQRNFENKITRLSLRLKLSDAQRAQLAEISEKHSSLAAQFGELMTAHDRDGPTAEIVEQIRVLSKQMNALDPENCIADLLSDEQKAQYEEYRIERATNRAETFATGSLSMIQEIIPLTREQKDRYFSEYASASLASENGFVNPEKSKEILKNILSNEEYAIFEEQTAAQFQFAPPRRGFRSHNPRN